MIKGIARLLLLRVLPRRILPIVTIVEAALFLRGLRKRSRVQVNDPRASRTAPPDGGLAAAPASAPPMSPGSSPASRPGSAAALPGDRSASG